MAALLAALGWKLAQMQAAPSVHALSLDAAAAVDAPAIAGGQWSQDHYSALSQINRKNVRQLRPAWTFDTGEPGGGMETNPLVVGRVVYAYTGSQKVVAIDAASGKLLWRFDSGIHGTQPVRGVSFWSDGRQSVVLAGIMNYLYALDAATGKPLIGFGEAGRIDLRKGLGGDYRQQSIVLTSPGVVFKDLIIVGGRNPETPPAPPGDIRAFDVHTGALVWSFHTIPHPGEPGYETWPANAWKTAGAANNWAGMTLDTRRGVVYVPTGSPVPDFYGGARVGDDRFADCLLALNAATGKLIWSFQGVHHDLWDRDFPAPPALVTVKRDGKMVDAVAQTTKQGFLFVLDRDTGKPLFPVEERPVLASPVPGEVSSRTQPFPLLPVPFARQTVTADDLTTRTPQAHEYALKLFHEVVSGDRQFYPLILGKETIAAPGFDGGAEWGGPGVDAQHGILYVNANDIANTGGLAENDRSAGLGLSTYQHQCSICHRDNRRGTPPEFPSIVDIDKRLTQKQIVERIHAGKGRMPSFPNIQGDQLQALLEYLRTGVDNKSVSAGGKGKSQDTELQHDSLGLTSEPPPPPDPAGAAVYARRCAICHGEQMEGIVPGFPSLIGVGSRMTSDQITGLVHSGKGRMPAFSAAQITPADMESLNRFLGAEEMLPGAESADEQEMNRYRFTGYHQFEDQDGYPAVKPPWGTLSAIDLNTGKYLWKVPLGYFPELQKQGVPTTGTPNYGGPVITAGGLVFIGATPFDRRFRAFDSATGALLWEYELPYASAATPTTYMVDGKQYVVLAAGGNKLTHGAPGGVYMAFALPN
jgi:glucose dehydrogenase